MRDKATFLRMLQEGHEIMDSCQSPGKSSRLEYLGDHIFDFTTYDGSATEVFSKHAVDVCEAISNQTTYEFIANKDDYLWFLLMVNMPFFADRLEWGTSIRGAWWSLRNPEFICCGLFLDGKQILDSKFTDDEWKLFVAAIVEYGRGEPNPLTDFEG